MQILQGSWFFRSKPFVLREWFPDFCFDDDAMGSVPTWIQLQGLDLQFWGPKTLDN